ncbi:MAG: hypothetical protein QM739_00710 [Propionivibrio sp.]
MFRPLQSVLNIAGRAYVPGDALQDAMTVAQQLASDNIACTVGYFHSGSNSPESLVDICNAAIVAVKALKPEGYISIKAPAFDYRSALLRSVVLKAKESNMLAHFDSHEHPTADATIACAAQAKALGARVGLSIPGRWQRSLADADLACQLGIRVRIVKGEWTDPTDPGLDMRHGFLRVIDHLAGRADEVTVATHDPWLATKSLQRLQAAGTKCELELLNGLPSRRMAAVAQEYSVPLRVYIPFGISWRPYALRKFRDNPRVLWWVVRDSVVGLLGR